MRKKFKVRSSEFAPEKRRPETENRVVKPKNESIIFGVSPVLEALRAESRRIDKILIADGAKEGRLNEIIDLARQKGIAWNKVPGGGFGKFVGTEVNERGVIEFVGLGDDLPSVELVH